MKLNFTFRYMVAITFLAISLGGCYTMIYHNEFRHLEEKPDIVEEETEIIYFPLPDMDPAPAIIDIIFPPPTSSPDRPLPPQKPKTAAPVKYRDPDNNNDRHRNGEKTTIRDNDGNRSGNNRSDRQRR